MVPFSGALACSLILCESRRAPESPARAGVSGDFASRLSGHVPQKLKLDGLFVSMFEGAVLGTNLTRW